MKVYMIGTAYLEDTLPSFPYLIALIAFSLAVVDCPNIVERLFGIDAGGKMASGLSKGLGNLIKDSSGDSKSQQRKLSRLGSKKALSPNGNGMDEDGESANKSAKDGSRIADILTNKGKGSANNNQWIESSEIAATTDDTTGTSGTGSTASVSSQLDGEQSEKRTRLKAPSPNDAERASHSQQCLGGISQSRTTITWRTTKL